MTPFYRETAQKASENYTVFVLSCYYIKALQMGMARPTDTDAYSRMHARTHAHIDYIHV